MRHLILNYSPYQVINILSGLIIVLIFLYSGLFGPGNGDYPVSCAHVSVYGGDCQTCGLSQSFSEMIRGNFVSAAGYNRNGPLLFGFFAAQLFLRILAGILLKLIGRTGVSHSPKVIHLVKNRAYPGVGDAAGRKERRLAITDAVVSTALFIICFRNLLIIF